MKPKCKWCSARVGRRSPTLCDYHAGYHAGRQSIEMRAKRAADPAYRERERVAVKVRMRALRAARRNDAALDAQLTVLSAALNDE